MKSIVFSFFGILILFLLFILVFPISDKAEKVVLKINRFDQELFSINSQNIIQKSNKWDKDFEYFNKVFASQIIQLPSLDNQQYYDGLLAFTQNEDMREAYDSTALLFSDFSDVKNELELAFSRVKTDFPSYSIPDITTFFGGFNYVAIATDSTLVIGLEMFLDNENYYSNLTHKYPKYMHQQFKSENLTSVAVNGWLESEFPLSYGDFLTQMIHYGKIKYVLNEFLVDEPSNIIMGYTLEQMEWCENNEFSIWKYLIEESLLYSKDQFVISKYMNPAPYSKGMPHDSPGQVAVWVGWKIVDEFMQNNSEISISELFEIKDAQYILNQSKYKP